MHKKRCLVPLKDNNWDFDLVRPVAFDVNPRVCSMKEVFLCHLVQDQSLHSKSRRFIKSQSSDNDPYEKKREALYDSF